MQQDLDSDLDPETAPRSPLNPPALAGLLTFLVVVGALINYKAGGAMGAIAGVESGGTIEPKALWFEGSGWLAGRATLVQTINYVGWVAIALSYGLLIGAAVKAVLPQRWLASTVASSGPRAQVLSSLLGAPLMLCSCCATPVFEGVYSRTSRLGPSLAILLAPPTLNPGALVLTFLLFPAPLGLGRLVASILLVVLGTAWIGRRFDGPLRVTPSAQEEEHAGWAGLLRAFGRSFAEVTAHSLPAIVLGIVLSAWLITATPIPGLLQSWAGLPLLLVVVCVAVLIAIPTFAEIPIGLALLQGGAPEGVVLAVLIAAPAVNLPSLLGVAKLASPKVSLATGLLVLSCASVAGLAVGV